MLDYWIRSLSARLWITSVAALCITLSLISALVIFSFNHSPPQFWQHDADMRTAQRVATGIVFDENGHPVSVKLDEQIAWLYRIATTELMYRVLDDNGRILLVSPANQERAPWGNGDLSADAGSNRDVTFDGRQFDLATVEVRHGDSRYFVQTATSIAFNKAVLGLKVHPIPGIVAFTLITAVITFSLTLTFTVRRVLRPLRNASRAAASITPTNLTTRLSDNGIPSEIKPLINAFNDVLSRLENGFVVQQAFLASAAHELQTPLTLIRGQIELQPEIEKKELLYREIDLMARQVHQLLHLAEVSESQNFTFGDVNRVDVAEDAVNYFSRKAEAKRVSLELDTQVAPPIIRADRSALFILLKNLIENAINVTPAEGAVIVSVDEMSIRVCDEGHGIDPAHMPFLFRRFWRAPDARHDGAGLGLAICHEIASAHEWRITVSPRAVGTVFTVWFDAAAKHAAVA